MNTNPSRGNGSPGKWIHQDSETPLIRVHSWLQLLLAAATATNTLAIDTNIQEIAANIPAMAGNFREILNHARRGRLTPGKGDERRGAETQRINCAVWISRHAGLPSY